MDISTFPGFIFKFPTFSDWNTNLTIPIDALYDVYFAEANNWFVSFTSFNFDQNILNEDYFDSANTSALTFDQARTVYNYLYNVFMMHPMTRGYVLGFSKHNDLETQTNPDYDLKLKSYPIGRCYVYSRDELRKFLPKEEGKTLDESTSLKVVRTRPSKDVFNTTEIDNNMYSASREDAVRCGTFPVFGFFSAVGEAVEVFRFSRVAIFNFMTSQTMYKIGVIEAYGTYDSFDTINTMLVATTWIPAAEVDETVELPSKDNFVYQRRLFRNLFYWDRDVLDVFMLKRTTMLRDTASRFVRKLIVLSGHRMGNFKLALIAATNDEERMLPYVDAVTYVQARFDARLSADVDLPPRHVAGHTDCDCGVDDECCKDVCYKYDRTHIVQLIRFFSFKIHTEVGTIYYVPLGVKKWMESLITTCTAYENDTSEARFTVTRTSMADVRFWTEEYMQLFLHEDDMLLKSDTNAFVEYGSLEHTLRFNLALKTGTTRINQSIPPTPSILTVFSCLEKSAFLQMLKKQK